MYFDALLLGTYTLRIVISSWRIDSLSLRNAPLYPRQSFLCLKSALPEINIATFTFFLLVLTWHIFLHPFTFNHMCLYI